MIDPDNGGLGDPRPRNHMMKAPLPGQTTGPQPTFAEHIHRPAYTFPGIKPIIDREAERARYPDHSLRSRMHGDWFIAQISNSLGNACCQRRPQDAQASLDRAVALRDILAIAVAASESAIVEVAEQLNLPLPHFAARQELTDGPRQLRRPKPPGERR